MHFKETYSLKKHELNIEKSISRISQFTLAKSKQQLHICLIKQLQWCAVLNRKCNHNITADLCCQYIYKYIESSSTLHVINLYCD